MEKSEINVSVLFGDDFRRARLRSNKVTCLTLNGWLKVAQLQGR